MAANPIGEAFILISPESAGFASKLKAQLAGIGGGANLPAITAVVGATAALIASGVEFQRVTQQIQQQTGATGDRLAGLADTVKTVFTQVPASLRDTTTAIDELTRRGVPLGSLLKTLGEQELFLAKITGSDLGTTVDSTTALFAKFNIPLAQQSRELDVLFKAQQASGKGLAELITPLTTGAAALKQFGFDLNTSTALVASLERAGINVAPALAALRLAFGKIAQEGKDPQTVLRGLETELTNGINPAKGMADAIHLFGTRSGVELANAIEQGRFKTADLLKLITDGKGGIVATGEATLSLGQRFVLLRNQIVAGLEPLGVATVTAIEAVVQRLGPAVGEVVTAGTKLAVALGPALQPVLVALGAGLSLIAPALSAFATGLTAIAGVVGAIPGPLRELIGVLGAVALGLGVAYTAVLAFNLGIIAMPGPIQVAVLAIAAIGAVLELFSTKSNGAAKAAKAQADSFSDASGVFNASVTSTVAGLSQYILAQEKAGKAGDLPNVLGAAGSNLAQFTTKVTGGAAAWQDYERKVIAALAAAGNDGAKLQIAAKALDQQRSTLIATVQLDIARAKGAGLITTAQVAQIQAQNTLKDGTIDYGAALDAVNKLLDATTAKQAASAAATDAQNLKTFQLSGAYRELVSQLSSGTITVDQFDASLGDLANISTKAAQAVGTELVNAMNAFVQSALGALPTVASAIDKFASDITSAQSTLTSALSSQASTVASAQQTLSSAFQSGAQSVLSAQQSLTAAITSRNEAIANATNAYQAAQAANDKTVTDARNRLLDAEQKANEGIAKARQHLTEVTQQEAEKVLAATRKLAFDKSPQAFIDNLNTQTAKTAAFMANLQKLVSEGFTPLAAELAKKGPEAAGGLAAALADDSVKAKAANSAASIGEAVTASFKAFLLKNFDPLKNDGTQLGESLITGIIDGINNKTGALDKTINTLTTHVVSVFRNNFRIESPSKVTTEIGAQFGEGFALGIESKLTRVTAAAGSLSQGAIAGLRRLEASQTRGQNITGQTGSDRADAQLQKLNIEQMVFHETIDPAHVAAEIAWRLLT